MKRALAILLLLPFLAGGHAPPALTYTELHADKVGFATWDCDNPRPYGWGRTDVLVNDPEDAWLIAIHEEDHVDHMMSYGSCEAWQQAKRYGGVNLFVQMEARAYCTSAQGALGLGRFDSLEAAVRFYAAHLTVPNYGFDLTYDQALELVGYYCGV